MKGITKDHLSVTKDYKSLFYSMKDQRKNNFALHLRPYTFQFSSIGRESPAFMIKWRHLNCLAKSPTFRIPFRKSPAFTSTIASRY